MRIIGEFKNLSSISNQILAHTVTSERTGRVRHYVICSDGIVPDNFPCWIFFTSTLGSHINDLTSEDFPTIYCSNVHHWSMMNCQQTYQQKRCCNLCWQSTQKRWLSTYQKRLLRDDRYIIIKILPVNSQHIFVDRHCVDCQLEVTIQEVQKIRVNVCYITLSLHCL